METSDVVSFLKKFLIDIENYNDVFYLDKDGICHDLGASVVRVDAEDYLTEDSNPCVVESTERFWELAVFRSFVDCIEEGKITINFDKAKLDDSVNGEFLQSHINKYK